MATFELGAVWPLTFPVTDADGDPVAVSVATLTITLPDGSTVVPALANPTFGTYTYDYATVQSGRHFARFSSTGPITAKTAAATVRDSTTDYATLEELKSHLGIGDTVDDEELWGALDAAQAAVERKCGRRFNRTASEARVFSRAVDGLLLVDDIATDTGLTVSTSNGDGTYTALDAGDWTIHPDNAIAWGRPITGIQLTGGTWTTSSSYPLAEVTAAWGWPTVPPEVSEAVLLTAARTFRRKDSPMGVAGFGDLGVIRVSSIDPDVERLLAPYVLPGFG